MSKEHIKKRSQQWLDDPSTGSGQELGLYHYKTRIYDPKRKGRHNSRPLLNISTFQDRCGL